MFEGEVYAPELEDTVRSSHSLRRSVECRVSSEERKEGRKTRTCTLRQTSVRARSDRHYVSFHNMYTNTIPHRSTHITYT